VASKTLLKKGKRNWWAKILWLGTISSYRFVGGKDGRRSPPKTIISAEDEIAKVKSS
jgi:hypothetical protein